MKKILLFIITLFILTTSKAQDQAGWYNRDIKKNEISINPLNIVAFGVLDIGYERVLTNNTTVGFDIFYRRPDSRDDDDINDDDDFNSDDVFDKEIAFTTKFKYFFGERIARGFYVEAFGMFSSGENEKYNDIYNDNGDFINSTNEFKEFTDFAIGFGVGGKFVSRNGFLLDLGFGLGRNLFDTNSPTIIARPTIYLGYRF
ncbi:hypothetical protein GCM10022393_13930 [Aquimarina addita]|uniref:Outer membrane protein beta-barrel domain-containing protein n=1 Tax=Aquimarina addita TaxID=870485 RepID=A0ABP7XFW6_9FLAO